MSSKVDLSQGVNDVLQQLLFRCDVRELVDRVIFLDQESRKPAPPFAGATEFAVSEDFGQAMPDPKPMIERFLGQLSSGIGEYEKLIAELEDRLHSALGPVVPDTNAGNETDREMSPMANDLTRFVGRIRAQNARIDNLLMRLEIPRRDPDQKR